MGARPDHQVWQGKVYKLTGSEPGYPNLAEATGYGTGAGLKGWNCRHDFYPFIPGISERAYTDEELNNIDPPPFEYEGKTYDAYEASQMQRRMETEMRKTKRELIGFENAGLDDDYTAAAIKLRRQKEYYKDFSNKAGLPLQNERMQVLGFGRKEAQKAVWAEKKSVTNSGSSGIIKLHKEVPRNQWVDTSQKEVNRVIKEYLPNVSFTKYPYVDNSERYNGCTNVVIDLSTQRPIRVKSILIGKQKDSSDEELVATLLHEELEARIALGKSEKYMKLYASSDDIRHEYIQKVINRFFKAKGWKL